MKDLNYYLQIKYPLTILQEDDGSYFAEYPDLKGCMTVAETFSEIHEMAEDAKLEGVSMNQLCVYLLSKELTYTVSLCVSSFS